MLHMEYICALRTDAPLGVVSGLRRVKSKAPALQNIRDKAGALLLARRNPESIVVKLRAESPVVSSTGQRPVGDKRTSTTSPERAKSGYLIRCRPFRAMGTGASLFTGRCPVLLIAGLSALNLTAMAWILRRVQESFLFEFI
jgi:hypothetical protein